MSEPLTMPEGYCLIRYGLFCWSWVNGAGYTGMFTKLTAKGAMQYAIRHNALELDSSAYDDW